MKAMLLQKRSPLERRPLQWVEKELPIPRRGEVLIQVDVCAICRTDLHVIEGELPVHRNPLIPGHQVVGVITQEGPDTSRFKIGDRVGVPWLFCSCGTCPYCRKDKENLCTRPQFTGYDVDGGYAEYIIAKEEFIYPIPKNLASSQAAPLLCAGIIGYRALRRSGIQKGGRLGLYGFGASAHVVIQIAKFWGCEVYVSTRGKRHQQLAGELGATWIGEGKAIPPKKLDGAILFAPAGELVPPALEALDKGGTLAIAGIYMTDIPPLNYEKHLFQERSLLSVTANTRKDGEELFRLAREIPIQTHTEVFSLAQANDALIQLKKDGIQGAGLLQIQE